MGRQRLIPAPGSEARFLLSLLRDVLRQPSTVGGRINPTNFATWRRYRHKEMRCTICGSTGKMRYEMPDLRILARHHIGPLRETLRCLSCGSKMRDRAVASSLLTELARTYGVTVDCVDDLATKLPANVRVLDTDANGRLAKRLGHHTNYVTSLFQPQFSNGDRLDNGAINVDLQHIPFDNQSFDVIITSEVLEHVRHSEQAHREIARCLRDDGAYIFTVPYDRTMATSLTLIDPETDEPLVYPMHMHGDPGMREEGIKSYRVFGLDIVETLRASGLVIETDSIHQEGMGLFDADVFLARRAATPSQV